MTHVIPIPIWDSRLHLILWPADLPAALAQASLTEGAQEIVNEDCDAITQLNDVSEPVIVVKHECRGAELIGLLAHEVFHAAQDVLHERGVRLSKKGENESHAYLIGWLMERVAEIALDIPAQAG